MVPFVKCGRKGLLGSLVALSIFIIPFLYVIDKIIGKASIMPVGTAVSLFSVFYLWCIYGIFNKLNSRKFLAFGLSLLLIIPLCLAINITIAKLFSIPILDIWDILSFGIVMIISVSLLVTDYIRNNKRSWKWNRRDRKTERLLLLKWFPLCFCLQSCLSAVKSVCLWCYFPSGVYLSPRTFYFMQNAF